MKFRTLQIFIGSSLRYSRRLFGVFYSVLSSLNWRHSNCRYHLTAVLFYRAGNFIFLSLPRTNKRNFNLQSIVYYIIIHIIYFIRNNLFCYSVFENVSTQRFCWYLNTARRIAVKITTNSTHAPLKRLSSIRPEQAKRHVVLRRKFKKFDYRTSRWS